MTYGVPSPPGSAGLVVLRAAGTAVVVSTSGTRLPEVLHWGPDLGGGPDDVAALPLATTPPVPASGLDEPWALTLVPGEADGWSGSPGVAVHRAGAGAPLRLRTTAVRARQNGSGTAEGGVLEVDAEDAARGVAVRVVLDLDVHGVVEHRVEVTNTGDGVLDVTEVRSLLPLPPHATQVLDLTGRWIRERSPQRSPLSHGTHRRASRRGRTGHDATLLLTAGTAGFGFRTGEVWSAHVAWSGDHEHLVEHLPEGAGRHASVLGGGELLRPGELRLEAGETYAAPPVLMVWSDEGLDGVSARLHRRLRARRRHPSSPRPVVLNTWEAVYFDHDLARLMTLADAAAAVGVERFVLDDGWFTGRRDDRTGLGDWSVDTTVWPQGLHPLVEHVRSLGMQFGLWVEPEMVNPDSDLVRLHPDWVLGPASGHPLPWRHQQVLDLTNREAWEHLLGRLDALVSEYRIDYLKWDHNRDLHEAVHTRPGAPDRPAVRTQTLAVYALLDALLERHPALEIESCASGGARVDLGILERTHRVWTSDCNDALERQQIQRWTGLLVPPELVGTHVGPPVAQTTHRSVDLGMRLATALFGHAGLEWDITTCTPDELDAVASWVALYKRLRGVLHGGDVVRSDPLAGPPGDGNDDELLHGAVSPSQDEAVFTYVRLASAPDAVPGSRRLPGLDPTKRYRVTVPPELPPPATVQVRAPAWHQAACDGGFVVSGAVLTTAGLAMPVLGPGQAVVLHLRAEAG